MLAQAVLLLRRHMDAWNGSTAPFWDVLVERVGPASPQALALCSFGLIVTSMQKETAHYPALMSRVGAVLERVARARGVSVDQVLDLIQQDPNLFVGLEPSLRALVPADQWVIEQAP